MEIVEQIKNAKADTLMRVDNVIYAKITDAPNSKWRSAFGEFYANNFINRVRQAKSAEFLTNEEPVRYIKKRRYTSEMSDVREKNSEIYKN